MGILTHTHLTPAQSPGGTAELEFSEDSAPFVREHSNLLILNDILFLGVKEVSTHCGSLDMGLALKAGFRISLWVLRIRQVAGNLSLRWWKAMQLRSRHLLLPVSSSTRGPEEPMAGPFLSWLRSEWRTRLSWGRFLPYPRLYCRSSDIDTINVWINTYRILLPKVIV